MASTTNAIASTAETPITIKVVFDGSNRKFKLPLHELTASVFAEKIRSILQIENSQLFVLERFSDSGNAYITLDQNNPSAYKQLYRAAKAKGKLRIRATLVDENMAPQTSQAPKVEQPKADAAAQPLATKLSCHQHSMTSGGRPVEAQATTSARDFSCLQARDQFFQQLANISREREQGRRMKEVPARSPSVPSSFWQIFCNNCDKPMTDAHFHCSICDGGDYDLCEACVETGKICPGEGHWLIKRFIKSGSIVTSATETVGPKSRESTEDKSATKVNLNLLPEQTGVVSSVTAELPVGWAQRTARDGRVYYIDHNTHTTTWKRPESNSAVSAAAPLPVSTGEANRTCNSCVKVLPESALVTCKDCPDYDLCVPCLKTEEGHHPAHRFETIIPSASLAREVATIGAPGRNVSHHAICDGCDKPIYGVRHKCLSCPDWDYCNKCHENVGTTHPGHRFVPVYANMGVAPASRVIHYGILCDGPLCLNKPGKAYIQGVRYKCAVCDDTDFCANCEAHPNVKHNETHPMIKFKTPVRGAHVTVIDDAPGRQPHVFGDAARRHSRLVPRAPSTQTITSLPPPYTPSVGIIGTNSKPLGGTIKVEAPSTRKITGADLDAHYIRDRVADGTKMAANTSFTQSWTLKNPGPHAWPQGSAVFFVGGDHMSATESNSSTKAVKAGEEYEFEVSMRTPARSGKHISYWRLKGPDGLPFGHKLWCDVEVAAPVVATSSGNSSPAHLVNFQTHLMQLEQLNKQRLRQQALAEEQARNKVTADSRVPVSVKEEDSPARSVMVFPILEKESPASSTIREAPATAAVETPKVSEDAKSEATTETAAETATTAPTVTEAEERFEDLESVEYDDSDSENDGFLTDEEYDILDASDEEVSNRGRSTM